MSDETNHELLSAYLDGELADDERQRVEQLLAESAECRQVYEELCALRASLSSLPRHKLAEDLGPRVLRIAEESKSGKEDKAASVRRGDEAIETAGSELAAAGNVSAAERTSRRWRAIVYPVLAVAAAVAMMLNSQKEKEKQDRHDRQIARAPMGQDPPASLSAPPSGPGDEESSAAGEYLSLSKAKASAPVISDDEDYDSVRDDAPGENAAPMTESERIAPSAGSGPAPAAVGKLGRMSAADAPTSRAAQGARKAESRLSPTTVVITCKLAPKAMQEKAFDALLARNHLVPWSAPAGVAGKPSPAAGQPSVNAYDSLERLDTKGDFDDRQNKRLERDGKHGEAESKSGKESAWAQIPWSKSVVVELDARQLAAVLADLHSHPEQFLSVELPGQQEDHRESALPTRPAAPAASQRGAQALPEQEPAFEAETAAESQSRGDDAKSSVKSDASAADSTQPSGNATRAAGGSGSKRVRVLFRLSEAPGN